MGGASELGTLGSPGFELILFSTSPDFIRQSVASGVAGIMVDWETRGKHTRQENWDTEINAGTPEDLAAVRAATSAKVICRLNGLGETTAAEVEAAVSRGADEILLPMVRKPDEVETVLKMARGRCGVGILIETADAVRNAPALGKLPLSRVYVGLNDLAIDRRLPNIFVSLADGTLDRIRPHFRAPFGFGGATLPEGGHPIPCRLLLGEMARLACAFTFLRRSFHRDVRGRDVAVEVPRIHQALAGAFDRTPSRCLEDRQAVRDIVGAAGAGRGVARAAQRVPASGA